VETINRHGGNLVGARGVPEDQLRKAAASAVCKINIDSDSRLAVTAVVRKILAENPGLFDPRKYLGPAREELIKMIKNKNINVLGNAGKA
jgi:fructose-bisphosphate aldolase class II